MREMPTYLGSATGHDGRTEGLSEVQESVLEHAAQETDVRDAQNVDSLGENLIFVEMEYVPDSWLTGSVEEQQLAHQTFSRNWDKIKPYILPAKTEDSPHEPAAL